MIYPTPNLIRRVIYYFLFTLNKFIDQHSFTLCRALLCTLAERLRNPDYATWWIEGPQGHIGRRRKYNSDEVEAIINQFGTDEGKRRSLKNSSIFIMDQIMKMTVLYQLFIVLERSNITFLKYHSS